MLPCWRSSSIPTHPSSSRTRGRPVDHGPLGNITHGGRIYVFGGNRGAPTNPAWYHNLVAHPDVTVEVGTEKFEARAIVLDSAEGERLGKIQVQRLPALAELQEKITRKVPVVLLERKK